MKLKVTLVWEYSTGNDGDTMTAYGTLDPEEIVKIDQESLDSDVLFMIETMDPNGLITAKIEPVTEKEKTPVEVGTAVRYHGSMGSFHGQYKVTNSIADETGMSKDGFRYWLLPVETERHDYIWNVRRQSFTVET